MTSQDHSETRQDGLAAAGDHERAAPKRAATPGAIVHETQRRFSTLSVSGANRSGPHA